MSATPSCWFEVAGADTGEKLADCCAGVGEGMELCQGGHGGMGGSITGGCAGAGGGGFADDGPDARLT